MIHPLYAFTRNQWAKIDAMRFRNAYPYFATSRLDFLALCVTEAIYFPAPKQEEPEEYFVTLADHEAIVADIELAYLSQTDALKRKTTEQANTIRGLKMRLGKLVPPSSDHSEAEVFIEDLAEAIAASFTLKPRQWLTKFGALQIQTTNINATKAQRQKAKELAKDYAETRKEMTAACPTFKASDSATESATPYGCAYGSKVA